MSCSNNFKKSAVSTVNTATQTVTAAATPLSLLGSVCYNSGCSLSANASGINIKSSGLIPPQEASQSLRQRRGLLLSTLR